MTWVILAFIAIIAALQARSVRLAQYLFFLRYPIGLTLVLMVLPILSVRAGKDLVGNLFVLGGTSICVVLAVGAFASGTLLYTFALIFALTPARTGLAFFRSRPTSTRAPAEKQAA